jgi:hypothetical protein
MSPMGLEKLAIALAVSMAWPTAQAQGTSAWTCALSDDLVRLHCAADDGAVPQAATTAVNGTAFPLDPRRRWVVDLWSPPTEIEFVERLARATICYRSPGCTVTVAAPSLATARVSARTR